MIFSNVIMMRRVDLEAVSLCPLSRHNTNDDVPQKVSENRKILDTVGLQQRKVGWIGHILRHDSLLRDIGLIKGKLLDYSVCNWQSKKTAKAPTKLMLSAITSNEYNFMDLRFVRGIMRYTDVF